MEGLVTGLEAEFKDAFLLIGTKVHELKSALKEWQGTAEAEVRENASELA